MLMSALGHKAAETCRLVRLYAHTPAAACEFD
jgi:hypothetical protein